MERKVLRSRGLRRLAKQTEGLLRVPQRLQSAITTFLSEYSKQQVKQHVARLSLMLKSARIEEPKEEHTSLWQPSDKVLLAVDDYIARKGPMTPVPKTNYFLAHTKVKYEDKQTAAYVAARMPAVYSVVHRVLSEVSRRLPDFKPVNVLDYGCGPGTSIWALREVWPGVVQQVNIVESSPSMAFACKKLLEDMEDVPVMHNHKNLRILSKTRHCGHDLVIASYAVGELPSVREQITAARQLWALTRDILVLIEPGTSEGSLTIRGIRAHILAIEKKKMRRSKKCLIGANQEKLEANQEKGEHLICTEEKGTVVSAKPDVSECKEDRIAVNINLPDEEHGGAHVVAPCPHDGVCPMDGTKQWCHFVQRLERTPSQRTSKKHSRKQLRGYEDEKYCYVVLRRGRRPRLNWPLDQVDLALDKEEPLVNEFIVDTDDELDENDEVDEGEDNEGDEEEAGVEAGRCEDEGEAGVEAVRCEDEGIDEDSENMDEDDFEEDEYKSSAEEEEDDREECTETVANMSSGWGRIIFRPYRRGRHVVLDVCRSTERDGSAGSFDRVIVTRAKHRVLHREAKKARWGDLWPCK